MGQRALLAALAARRATGDAPQAGGVSGYFE